MSRNVSFRRSKDGARAVQSTTTTIIRANSIIVHRDHTTTMWRRILLQMFLLATIAVATAAADHGIEIEISGDDVDHDDLAGFEHTMSEVLDQHFVGQSIKYSNTMSDDSPSSLKQKIVISKNGTSGVDSSDVGRSNTSIDFLAAVEDQRRKLKSIEDYQFNEKRVRTVSMTHNIKDHHYGILYWCFRDQRVHDNWGLLYAQKLAIREQVPLYFLYITPPKYSYMSIRQYRFMFQGLEEVEAELEKLNIRFHFKVGYAPDIIPNFMKTYRIGGIVIDFLPIREYVGWIKQLTYVVGYQIPIYQVDSHNIVPCWLTSNKQEYATSTIRKRINPRIPEFLTEFPPVIKHPFTSNLSAPEPVNWEHADANLPIDRDVLPITTMTGGYKAGMMVLNDFLDRKLKYYFAYRNNPLIDGLSNLSSWLHFGQISAQRCLLEATKKRYVNNYPTGFAAFREEIVIRKELSDNFCHYNPKYDLIGGASPWARVTLDEHRDDERRYLYTQLEFEKAITHDDLWNSCQIQMMTEGKMHRFLRMYWAKKILEWSITPEGALSTAIYLNNKYSLDGSDPISYVGCMWAICGIHDRPWHDGPIHGTLRSLTYNGTNSLFDVKAFVDKYGGIIHTKL